MHPRRFFSNVFHIRYRICCFELLFLNFSFELTLNRRSKSGLSQAEKMECYLRKTEAQVYMSAYTRTVLSKFTSSSTPNKLRQHNHRYQSPLFELRLLNIEVLCLRVSKHHRRYRRFRLHHKFFRKQYSNILRLH